VTQIFPFLLIAVAAVGVVAKRSNIPPAILLVLTGVVLALVPGLPAVRLAPELILLLVLPPLIYSSAVAMSWREFRFNLRPISLLAVGCVVFTTAAAAAGTLKDEARRRLERELDLREASVASHQHEQ
jgi:monovalent cation/hydrogen antiporter